MNYTGKIKLNDDVNINGKFITFDRIISGKPSIYEKYGFNIEQRILQEINNTTDHHKLKILTRNIPMIAANIEKFNQC